MDVTFLLIALLMPTLANSQKQGQVCRKTQPQPEEENANEQRCHKNRYTTSDEEGEMGQKGAKGVRGRDGQDFRVSVDDIAGIDTATINRLIDEELKKYNWRSYDFDQNIDECALRAHDCSVNATCKDTLESFTCSCNAGYYGDGVSCIAKLPSCKALLEHGHRQSGIYMIYPFGANESVSVYCDQDTDGGGWMLIQRRINGQVEFYRNWSSSEAGFGDIGGEHWLGLDYIYKITSSGNHELRIELEDLDSQKRFAKYSNFEVGGPATSYTLRISGYTGNAGDSLKYHNNMMFSTYDRDNDRDSRNCAVSFHGPWWYKSCHHSNLNGRYGSTTDDGVNWKTWHGFYYSMKTSQMKVRPR